MRDTHLSQALPPAAAVDKGDCVMPHAKEGVEDICVGGEPRRRLLL